MYVHVVELFCDQKLALNIGIKAVWYIRYFKMVYQVDILQVFCKQKPPFIFSRFIQNSTCNTTFQHNFVRLQYTLPTKICIKIAPCLHQKSANWVLNMVLWC